MHCTAVHFLFTEANSHHPLHQFLSESLLHFSLHSDATSAQSSSAAGTTLMSGEVSMKRMLDSNPDGFLSQTWVMMYKGHGAGAIQCRLKLTLGLVCDHMVSTEYVALRSYADAFVPCREYFASEALPMTWVASIMGDKPSVPGDTGEFAEVDQRAPSRSQKRRDTLTQRAMLLSSSLQTLPQPVDGVTKQTSDSLEITSSGFERQTSPFGRREPEFEAEPNEASDEAMIDEVVDGLQRLSELAREATAVDSPAR
jgi:hypothetical protein